MRLYQNLGYLFALLWVCLLTGCGFISHNLKSDLVTILCRTNQSCIKDINEQTWQGEKRRDIIKQIAKKYDSGKTLPSVLFLQDFSNHHIYILNAQATWVVFHSTIFKMTKYYDLQTQQEIKFNQILNPATSNELSNAIRNEFKKTLINNKFLFNWKGDRNEQNYEKWLNENMPQIIEKGGSLTQDKNKTLLLEYCNAREYADNAFRTCITLPANEFLKIQ